MSLLTMYKRLIRQADLMDTMVDKLGVRPALEGRADQAGVMRRAANRCMSCTESAACQQWLDDHETASEAPQYCRNHDLFERLRRDIEAEGLSRV